MKDEHVVELPDTVLVPGSGKLLTKEQIKERMKMGTFEKELEDLINTHSMENASNTPDFILAQYLKGCLETFNVAIQQRENWYGRDPRPSNERAGDADAEANVHKNVERK